MLDALTNAYAIMVASWHSGFYQFDRYALKHYLENYLETVLSKR